MKEHISYELAKRLHDKGFRGEHENVWAKNYQPINLVLPKKDAIYKPFTSLFPAYTFTELWGVLPRYIGAKKRYRPELELNKRGSNTVISYPDSHAETYDVFEHEFPAECAGLMLEWLIDNGYVEVKDER
jgi:hypothetical protein